MELAPKIREVLVNMAGKPALEFEGTWHTWGDIGNLVDRVGRLLTEAGVTPDAPVGLVARNRTPGCRTGARPWICSDTASSFCGSAPRPPTPVRLNRPRPESDCQ